MFMLLFLFHLILHYSDIPPIYSVILVIMACMPNILGLRVMIIGIWEVQVGLVFQVQGFGLGQLLVSACRPRLHLRNCRGLKNENGTLGIL